MIDPKRVRERIFKALKSQDAQLKMYDEEGMSTVDSEVAVRFYVDKPNLLIHVDGDEEEVIFNKQSDDSTPLDDYADIISAIKTVVREYMYNFTIKNYGKKFTPKDFSYQVKKVEETPMDNVQESAMYGTKKTSRQVIEDVNVVIKHRREVDETIRGSRSRDIQAIFLEHAGERYRFPHNNLLGARSMARHLASGGAMHDVVGESIVDMTGKMIKLREFYTYSKRNKLINEDSEDVISALVESINSIKYDLNSLFKKRTYETTALRISEQENYIAETDDGTDYKDMFTVKKFNDVFEDILPVISNIVQEKNMRLKRIEESSMNPVPVISSIGNSTKGMQFESKAAKMGYRIKDVAESICENAELAEFMLKMGDKMISEGNLSEFEMQVVGNVLQNVITETSDDDRVDLMAESLNMFEKSLSNIEQIGYNSMLSEGIFGTPVKIIKESNTDELFDLGTRLKHVQYAIQDGSITESLAIEEYEAAVEAFINVREGKADISTLKECVEMVEQN